MTSPIALQLYSLREEVSHDFDRVVDRVAAKGYAGIEPAFGHLGTTPDKAARRFKDLGLQVPSTHVPLPLDDDQERILDFMRTMDSKCMFSGRGPDYFSSLDETKRTCDLLNRAHAVAAEHGMSFGIHNHWWEFEKLDGRYVYHIMLEHLHPEISWELDVYWIQVAGLNPADIVAEFGTRAPLLHIKDGPAIREEPMVAVGQGVLDTPAIVGAGQGITQWLVVELDHCATDMQTAVDESFDYLVAEGLGHGR
jgi:sugar phosphate isomerase/epimerase